MTRGVKHTTEEDRQNAIRQSKTKYMLAKSWICDACDNRDYSLAGKWMHCKTKKHITNVLLKSIETDDKFDLIPVE